MDPQAQQDHKESRALPDLKVQKGILEIQDHKAFKGPQVLQVLLARKVFKARPDQREIQGIPAQRDRKVFRELPGLVVLLALQVQPDRKVSREPQVQQVPMALRGDLAVEYRAMLPE
jgi:hypothetical protein